MDKNIRRSVRNIQSEEIQLEADLKEQKKVLLRSISLILKKDTVDRSFEDSCLLDNNKQLVVEIQKKSKFNADIKMRNLEIEDSKESLQIKCNKLATAIRRSKHLIIYTGAGISTAASIPDYRGPNGVWTLLKQGKQCSIPDLLKAQPTFTHMAISQLYKIGLVKHVVSQNCDGLHMRSNLSSKHLSEVHGNMHVEICRACSPVKEYIRLFDVTEKTAVRRHKTDRYCHKCGAPLFDTIVHFGEKGRLDTVYNWHGATRAAKKADVIVCLGTSLKVLKKYSCLWPSSNRPFGRRPQLYIVNLQWTPKDRYATLKINGKCDSVMKQVMKKLLIKVPSYTRKNDPIFKLAYPLSQNEMCSTSKPLLKLTGFKGRPKGSLNKIKALNNSIKNISPHNTSNDFVQLNYCDISQNININESGTLDNKIDMYKDVIYDSDLLKYSENNFSDISSTNSIDHTIITKLYSEPLNTISPDNKLIISKNICEDNSMSISKINNSFEKSINNSNKKYDFQSNIDSYINVVDEANLHEFKPDLPKFSRPKKRLHDDFNTSKINYTDYNYLPKLRENDFISTTQINEPNKPFLKTIYLRGRPKGSLNKIQRMKCDVLGNKRQLTDEILNKQLDSISNICNNSDNLFQNHNSLKGRPRGSLNKTNKFFNIKNQLMANSENFINIKNENLISDTLINNKKINNYNSHLDENICNFKNENDHIKQEDYVNLSDLKNNLNNYLVRNNSLEPNIENYSQINYVPVFNFPRVVINTCNKQNNQVMNSILPSTNLCLPSNLFYSTEQNSNNNLFTVDNTNLIKIQNPVFNNVEKSYRFVNERFIAVSSPNLIKNNNLNQSSSNQHVSVQSFFKLATNLETFKDIQTSIINNGTTSTIISYNINNLLNNSMNNKEVNNDINGIVNQNNNINKSKNIKSKEVNSSSDNTLESHMNNNILAKSLPILENVSQVINMLKTKEIELAKVISNSINELPSYSELNVSKSLENSLNIFQQICTKSIEIQSNLLPSPKYNALQSPPISVNLSSNCQLSLVTSNNLIPSSKINSNFNNSLGITLNDLIKIHENSNMKFNNSSINNPAGELSNCNKNPHISVANISLDNLANKIDTLSDKISTINKFNFKSCNPLNTESHHSIEMNMLSVGSQPFINMNNIKSDNLPKNNTIFASILPLPTLIRNKVNANLNRIVIKKIKTEKIKEYLKKDLNVKNFINLGKNAPGWFGRGLNFTRKNKKIK